MVGPQHLHWDEFGDSEEEDKPYFEGGRSQTSRGIMMGLPTSWFFLCLLHFFWIDEACGRDEILKSRAAVCGDDLVALWPKDVI